MSQGPDTRPDEPASFDDAERASKELGEQIKRARKVLDAYRDSLEADSAKSDDREGP